MSSEEIHGTLTEGTPITIVLGSASILTGMRRSRLILEAQQEKKVDLDRILLRLLYADVASAMLLFRIDESGSITDLPLPIPFETFLTISDVTGAELERAVYRVNPHWIMKTKEEEEDPKG